MPVKSASKTTKRFTVTFGCCDPPVPVAIWNTNSESWARRLFNTLKKDEIAETKRTGAVGGEWNLTWYEHTPESKIRVFKTDEDEDDGVYVYMIMYPGSIERDNYSYMDAAAILGEDEED